MGPDIEVYVRVDDHTFLGGLAISIAEKRNGKFFVAKPVQLEFVEVDGYTRTEPTLQLDPFSGQALLEAFAKALDKAGVKTDVGQVRAALDATKYHLEDMRTLVLGKAKE